jgi:sulfatase maturation enzyme AslB (radical SAM superfamily)
MMYVPADQGLTQINAVESYQQSERSFRCVIVPALVYCYQLENITVSTRWIGIGSGGQTTVAYDPCTGLIHKCPWSQIPPGRQLIEENELLAWPIVHPRELQRDRPLSVCWSPIVACNLRCPHCLDDKGVSESDAALRFQASKVLGQSGVLGIDISGGEPLLIPELPRLLDELIAAERVVSITTSGWHLASRAAELSGRVDALRISLDGSTPELHDKWRGQHSFARALEGLRTAVRLGVPVQIQTVAMRSTIVGLQDMVKMAAAENVCGITILQMLPIGEGAALAVDECVSDADAIEALSHLHVPPELQVRLRTRESAGGFTVIRADRAVWRNGTGGLSIHRGDLLTSPGALALGTQADGSA